ncbi:MAG: penicillin-binding protein 2 [Nitrospirae bacterium]|nr:penicillin-binding protein 2 [Nitrospirota bacterium]
MRRRGAKKPETKKLWDEDLSNIHLKKSKRKAVILATVICFGFAVISFRLVNLMVLNHKTLSQKASRQYDRVKTIKPYRGVVWDRNMKEMAVNIEADSLYAVPSKINDSRLLSSKLAPIIKASAVDLDRKILSKKKKGFIWLARKMDETASARVATLKDEMGIDTIDFFTETRRHYPNGETASHILGYANIDNRGLEGIELKFDEYMKGEDIEVTFKRDALGNKMAEGTEDPLPGNNLLLTIDENLQYVVERELSAAMEEWKAKAAIVIMMNPMTGEILALANRPSYDPNFPAGVPGDKRRNRAITDMYEPGSTFKSFLAAAAIEEKVVRINEMFDVSKGSITVGGKTIHDVHRHGVITFEEIIQKSSNVGAVKTGLRLGATRYYDYMKKFGFGEKTGIDLPGEMGGLLKRPQSWSGTSLACMSFGQEIGVTPLQLLNGYAAIANGGVLMKPYVVSEIISPEGEVIKKFSPQAVRRVVSTDTAAKTRNMLKKVVEEGGTARKAYIKGNLVAGKTGTAQMVDPATGRYSSNKFVSSFVGFVPADNPAFALIVVVYEPVGGSYGGTVAAPVFRKISEHALTYLDVPMETDENHVLLVSDARK